jgi:hypothetical protein
LASRWIDRVGNAMARRLPWIFSLGVALVFAGFVGLEPSGYLKARDGILAFCGLIVGGLFSSMVLSATIIRPIFAETERVNIENALNSQMKYWGNSIKVALTCGFILLTASISKEAGQFLFLPLAIGKAIYDWGVSAMLALSAFNLVMTVYLAFGALEGLASLMRLQFTFARKEAGRLAVAERYRASKAKAKEAA